MATKYKANSEKTVKKYSSQAEVKSWKKASFKKAEI